MVGSLDLSFQDGMAQFSLNWMFFDSILNVLQIVLNRTTV